MAGFRLSKKQSQPEQAGVNQPDLDQEQQAGLLSTLGGGAMSGLHTVGSLMSAPSRAIWGSVNGMAGGDGGYGNMNPWDSTGGVEASHVLGNAGLIAKNDPTRWELIPHFQNGQINPGDLGRGIIDMLGDPTSYIGVGALTKAGSKAAREGARVAGFANQLRQGHRAALTFGLPFSEASHAIGTGEKAAKIFESTGIPKLAAKAAKSAPVRHIRGVFDWMTGGKTHADVQPHMPEYFKALQDAKHENAGVILRHASQLRKSGHISLDDEDNLRKAFEGLGGHDPHGHAEEFHKIMNKMLAVDEHLGTGAHRLDDKVLKTVDGVTGMFDARLPVHRRITAGASKAGSNLSTASSLARKQSGDRKIDRIYKGAHGGTSQMNEMTREHTGSERNPLYAAMESVGPDATKDEMAKAVLPVLKEKWGDKFEDKMFTPQALKKIDKYAEKIGKHEKLKLDLDAKQAQLASMSPDEIGLHGINKHKTAVEKMQANLADPEYMKSLPDKALGAHIRAKDKLNKIVGDAAEFAKLPAKKQKYITKRLANLEAMTVDQVKADAVDAYKRRFEKAVLRPEAKVAESAIKSHPRVIEKVGNRAKVVADVHIPKLKVLHEEALKNYTSRHEKFARKFVNMAQDPAIRKVGLFGNHVLADALEGWNAASRRHIATHTVQRILAGAKHYEGDDGVRLADWMNSSGYDSRQRNMEIPEDMLAAAAESGEKIKPPKEWGPAIQRIAEHAGVDADTVAEKMLDPAMLESIKDLTPKYKGPAAETALSKAFKSGMSWWKGGTLAFPASRTRDAMGGVVQNALHGWINPKYTVAETNRLLSGKTLKEDYSHVPFVKDWLEKTGSESTPENQTEAVRQMIGVYLPSESNMLADVATGQHAASLEHVLHNVPGQTDQSFIDQAFVQPAKTLIGKGTPSSSGEVPSWFGHGEKGEGIGSRIKKAVKQQGRLRGVADQEETLLAPVKASEQVSAASDQFNRVGPFLQMTSGGFDPKEAARRIGKAQVDYNPETFTPAERWIKNYIAPFYSFQSRMLGSTAGQLADLKSPTSQLVKALDRAKSASDPSIPDYVMSQTGTSIGEDQHGNKQYLVGAGLMHDPAVSLLGLLAGGNARPAAYDTLSMLGPHIGIPLQRTVGQSFFQRGEPISQLDPTIPRLISNIGESTGLMEPDPHAVDRFKYPGYQHVDMALGALPYSRELNAARTIADPRKGLVTKLLDTLTGLKVQDISPEKQLSTLKKRAEKLAEEHGGYKYSRVIMPEDQKEALRAVNPMLAAKQDKLEVMLKEIYGKKKKSEAKQSENYRLKRKKKSEEK